MTTSPSFGFERTRRAFQLFGREYYFEFIPSIHFQDTLRQVLELLAALDFSGLENSAAETETRLPLPVTDRVFPPLRRLLEEKTYDILFDVLLYQNNERVELTKLKYQTSPLEIAAFLNLLLTDAETIEAVGVLADGLGKLIRALTASPWATANSTPFS